MRPARFILFLLCSAQLCLATTTQSRRQIQAIPTPFVWQGNMTSYDNMARYSAGHQVNGLALSAPAFLGCRFDGPYIDRVSAFGLLAWDNMSAYVNGAALNGLNLGNGVWPQTIPTSTAYVDKQDAFPMLTWDSMTNSVTYTNTAFLDGLNGGTNNLLSLVWTGPYVDDARRCGFYSGPTLTYSGGILTLGNNQGAGYGSIYVTFDGSSPGGWSGGVVGAVSTAPAGSSNPLGIYSYDGPFTLPWSCTVKAIGSAGCGCPPNPCAANYDSAVTSSNLLSIGETWSNNVTANGGAAPAATSCVAINTFGAGLNNDGLIAESPPFMQSVCVFAPDNLTAAITPIIYAKGNQPWVNHNFIAGDLTGNGLVGDAATKYLDSGVAVTALPFSSTSGGLTVYLYTNTASGTCALGVHDSAPANSAFDLFPNTTGNSIGELWSFTGAGNTVSGSTPATSGFFSLERTAANSLVLYFANSLNPHAALVTDSTAQTLGVATGGQPVYVFALNNVGSLFGVSAARISVVSLNAGLSAGQSASLYAREQTLRTSFGGGFR